MQPSVRIDFQIVCASVVAGTASPTGMDEAHELSVGHSGLMSGHQAPAHAASAPPMLETVRTSPISMPSGQPQCLPSSYGTCIACPSCAVIMSHGPDGHRPPRLPCQSAMVSAGGGNLALKARAWMSLSPDKRSLLGMPLCWLYAVSCTYCWPV